MSVVSFRSPAPESPFDPVQLTAVSPAGSASVTTAAVAVFAASLLVAVIVYVTVSPGRAVAAPADLVMDRSTAAGVIRSSNAVSPRGNDRRAGLPERRTVFARAGSQRVHMRERVIGC